MWIATLGVIGRPELVDDPRFADPAARWENRDALNAIIEEWTGARTKHEVMRLLGAAGVPCGAGQGTGGGLADPHLKGGGMIGGGEDPTPGAYKKGRWPLEMSEPPREISPAPLL